MYHRSNDDWNMNYKINTLKNTNKLLHVNYHTTSILSITHPSELCSYVNICMIRACKMLHYSTLGIYFVCYTQLIISAIKALHLKRSSCKIVSRDMSYPDFMPSWQTKKKYSQDKCCNMTSHMGIIR